MTKREAFEAAIGDTPFDAVDYALPQLWCDQTEPTAARLGLTYHHIIGGFVWLYDQQAPIFGRPFPVTPEAFAILQCLSCDLHQTVTRRNRQIRDLRAHIDELRHQ